MKIGNTILLQCVNKLFDLMPLTRGYGIRSRLLCLAGIDCAKSARIVASARITMRNISIGEDTFIGHQVLISGNAACKITIGSNVDIAPRVVVISGTHKIDMIGEHSAGVGDGGQVYIEDGVWIGANSTVLPGVTIGRKAVVGAGSVVNCNIPAFTIAVGNPCRVIKKWDVKMNVFMNIKE